MLALVLPFWPFVFATGGHNFVGYQQAKIIIMEELFVELRGFFCIFCLGTALKALDLNNQGTRNYEAGKIDRSWFCWDPGILLKWQWGIITGWCFVMSK